MIQTKKNLADISSNYNKKNNLFGNSTGKRESRLDKV